ncbi:DUF4291 domain-containing protein [Mucilaginibacter paludis]|uniref:DUF4291 domain-containing protein n=1 Tax=Mucilaginibacter paludis DSM 18603 TaxID=714943 RepID=H1Y1D0_9SPHI|nr:DUF4291 domain-containing protein [Mucilaginibacter paludis]EHQ30264.1 hypothetical protein Mucpa_6207 [Mucilaginibacter paludis DSM 18603]
MSLHLYKQSLTLLPQNGQHILAHQTGNDMVVYQAYKPGIAKFAVDNQFLGGPDFSFTRMSWIKPNFLWMMYRCGWAEKENQERVLAIWIAQKDFEEILRQAVFSSFNPQYYRDHDHWKNELSLKEVRLQWDPDHDPYGNKVERRAIQLGLKGEMLRFFSSKIKSIEDITDFVNQQKNLLDHHGLDELEVPVETIFKTSDPILNKQIGITTV